MSNSLLKAYLLCWRRTSVNFVSSSKGFTLIEVMVALAILAGGLVVLNSSWNTNNLRIRKANMYNHTANFLKMKMAETEALYAERSIEEIPESESGDFGSEFANYRWTLESRELEFPDLSSLMIGDGQGNETLLMMVRQMTEMVSKSIKEVKITIFVKADKKEVPFSATTYFVDYSKNLGLPGGGNSP